MKLIVQEHPMGCAVACVASLLGTSYRGALALFNNKSYASTKGYYCKDIGKALKKKRLVYVWKKFSSGSRLLLNKKGVIVFISRSKKYPAGHYLLKTGRGWMNPWINFPQIAPAKAGFQKRLPGKPQWIMYPKLQKETPLKKVFKS